MPLLFISRWLRLLAYAGLVAAISGACAGQTSPEQRAAALESAMWAGDIQHAKSILASGTIPESNSENLCWIQAAVTLNLPSLILPLVKAGVPVDCKNTNMTAFQYAVATNRYQAAKVLIRAGANVNVEGARNKEGEVIARRPLNSLISDYLGIKFRQKRLNSDWRVEDEKHAKQLIRLLLEDGADPNLLDEPGSSTPLSISAQLGESQLVRWLLEAGADPNQISNAKNGGVTPIETAIFNDTSNVETVEALLYAGADPTAGPHADQLLDKARQNMPEAVPLLKQYGAK